MDISKLLKQISKGITHCLFPYHCTLCHDKTNRDFDLCIECEEFLPWLKNVCIYCAAPLIFQTQSVCGTCLKKPLPFHKLCIFFFLYRNNKKIGYWP